MRTIDLGKCGVFNTATGAPVVLAEGNYTANHPPVSKLRTGRTTNVVHSLGLITRFEFQLDREGVGGSHSTDGSPPPAIDTRGSHSRNDSILLSFETRGRDVIDWVCQELGSGTEFMECEHHSNTSLASRP